MEMFRELEDLDNKCVTFIKFTRIFEDISREIEASIKKSEAFSKITRLFEEIFNRI
jgi:hypothetical protein